MNILSTDICIIGAGPVGLFAVFEAGVGFGGGVIVAALAAIGVAAMVVGAAVGVGESLGDSAGSVDGPL